MFVTVSHFHHSDHSVFVGKAGGYQWGLNSNGWLPTLPPNTRLGWKWLTLTNTLACSHSAKLTALNSYILGLWKPLFKDFPFLFMCSYNNFHKALIKNAKHNGFWKTLTKKLGPTCQLWMWVGVYAKQVCIQLWFRSIIDVNIHETFSILIYVASIHKRLRFPPLLIRTLGLCTQTI